MTTYTEQERQTLEVGRLVKAGLTQPLGQMPQGSVGRILAVSGMGDHDVELVSRCCIMACWAATRWQCGSTRA